jgi:hypothetical protein
MQKIIEPIDEEKMDIVDPNFRQYDSISVSPEGYDSNIPLIIYGDSIVKFLSSPMSSVSPDDYLSVSTF